MKWLDDRLVYAESSDDLLEVIDVFLKQCIKCVIRLNAPKCKFLRTEMEWCGRRFFQDDWAFEGS